jgi:hypothetical protein
MAQDAATAARYLAPDATIVFTGRRRFSWVEEIAAFNNRCYAWVKKLVQRNDVCSSERGFVIYNIGTLFGAWPDGTPFEGNRYLDRFEVEDGLIVRMDVWNDSAERLLMAAEGKTGAGYDLLSLRPKCP